jgi:glycosyltransferase involved in cell wall biosynthesis
MPTVSILMPAYNAERFIAAAIDSVLQQTFTDWELIITNDGSTDNTLNIAQRYAALDSRVRVIHFEQNSANFARMRNQAFHHAKAPFIACLDSDDLYEPDALNTLHAYLAQHPDCPMVYGAFGLIDEAGQPTMRQPFGVQWNGAAFTCRFTVSHTWPNVLLSRVPNQMQAMLFRKSLLNTLAQDGCVWPEDNPDFMYLGDWFLTLQLYDHVFHAIKALPKPVFRYRQNTQSMTYNSDSLHKKVCSALAILDWFYGGGVKQVPGLAAQQKSMIYATTIAMHARPALAMGHHKPFWQLMGTLWAYPGISKLDALLVTAKTFVRTYIQRQSY